MFAAAKVCVVLHISLAFCSSEPLEAHPLLQRAAAAGQEGGKRAVERVLVDAALEDGASPMPWVGLGMLHSQSNNDKEAASTLWAAHERLQHRLDQLVSKGPSADAEAQVAEAHVRQVSMWMQASLSKPPMCARFLCPASSNSIRENTEQVQRRSY